MQTAHFIAATEFCNSYHIEPAFLRDLQQSGLLEISFAGDSLYIPEEQLSFLEKMVRLHYDLEINLEGLEAIAHLLNRIESLQQEAASLKNRLGLYEEGEAG